MALNLKLCKLNKSGWNQKFGLIGHSNLLQSDAYAQSMRALNHQKPCHGLIVINNKEAGIYRTLQVGIMGNLIHAVILDRGPLWFDGYGSQKEFLAFAEAFNKKYPRRFGRKRRFIPEISGVNEIPGFKKIPGSHYETIRLDLTKSEQALKSKLKKNWRNTLSKAEKNGLTCEWDEENTHLRWILQNYAIDKKTKGYDGPSVKLIYTLAKFAARKKDILIGRALRDGKPIAGILILRHGRSATYQIGWTSDEGRKTGAHNFLLWESLGMLKSKAIEYLDLGGINDETAKGIKKFKEGMGGKITRLSGLYT